MAAANDTLYFQGIQATLTVADGQLWKSDGMDAHTSRVTDNAGTLQLIFPGAYATGLGPIDLAPAGSGVAFNGYADGSDNVSLWYSDGTKAGTRQLSSDFSSFSKAKSITPVGDQIFYTATNQNSLFVADKNAAGSAHLVSSALIDARSMRAIGGMLYFAGYTDANGSQFWTSDGTVAGTQQIKVLSNRAGGALPGEFTAVGGTVYFTGYDENDDAQLWKTDGTTANTTLVSHSIAFTSPYQLTAVGNHLFFAAQDSGGQEQLWTTDGDDVTQLTSTLSNLESATALGDELYFLTRSAGNELHVWSSDGTAGGTSSVADLILGTDPSAGFVIVGNIDFNGRYAFVTRSNADSQLWIYDPSDQSLVSAFDSLNTGEITDLSVVGDSLFFLNNGTIQKVAVPEPATVGLISLFGLGSLARRRRTKNI
jgi:ELWxxDGT repeat protein